MPVGTLPDNDQDERTKSLESDEEFEKKYGAAQTLKEMEQEFSDSPGSQNDPGTSSSDAVGAAEASPSAIKNSVTSNNKSAPKAKLVVKLAKNKGAWGAVVFVLGLAGITVGGSLVVGEIAPIAFVETVSADLNDVLAASQIADNKVVNHKIPTADRKAALKGCTTLSKRCEFMTLSNKEVERLHNSGIDVTPDSTYKNLIGLDRVVPAGYTFQGANYDPPQWAAMLNTNADAQKAQKKANNMKFLGASDNTFVGRILQRFGVSKLPPELKGTDQERVNALLNLAKTSQIEDLHFTAVDPNDPNTKYTLDGDTSPSPTQYVKADVDKMNTAIVNIKTPTPPSGITKGAIGALSIFGIADLSCTITNVIGSAAVAGKIATHAQLIQSGFGLLSKVQQIQAGDGTVEDANAVGDYFSQPDNRAQIVDLASSLQPGQTITPADTLGMKPNPDYKKNALDSPLYQMSQNGGVAPQTPDSTQFSLGFGSSQVLAAMAGTAQVLHAVLNFGTDNSVCGFVQSGVVRGIGILGTLILAIVPGGQAVDAGDFIIGGVLLGVVMVLQQILSAMLGGNVVQSADLKNNPVARGDAAWTTVAAIQSDNAQASGLMPGDASQIVAYNSDRQTVNDQYVALEQSQTNQLDINSQYSFVGSLARSILKFSPDSGNTVAASLGSIASIVRGGLLSPFSEATASADGIDPSRFHQCTDASYQHLGIDADVQCNIRFVMPASDLALDIDPVQDYMENTGCGGGGCVAKNTTTGLPPGYTPVDPAVSQGAILDFLKGKADDFVGQFVNQRATDIEAAGGVYNDYAKFLDFCAYRVQPYGETYDSNQPVDAADADWQTGKQCRVQNQEMSYFRMYTLYNRVNDDHDNGASDPSKAADQGGDGSTVATAPSGQSLEDLASLLLAISADTPTPTAIPVQPKVVAPAVVTVSLALPQSTNRQTVATTVKRYTTLWSAA